MFHIVFVWCLSIYFANGVCERVYIVWTICSKRDYTLQYYQRIRFRDFEVHLNNDHGNCFTFNGGTHGNQYTSRSGALYGNMNIVSASLIW